MKLLAFVLALLSLPVLVAAQEAPSLRFSLVLPEHVSSENVDIKYFARGSFGGRGGWLKARAGLRAYELHVAGKEVSLIAYMPGCQIVTLDLIAEMPASQPVPCIPIQPVTLKGQISPTTELAGRNAKVDASYEASWAFQFFGISDGFATAYSNVATAKVDETGSFTILLPDFARSPSLANWKDKGKWSFAVVDAETGEAIMPLKATGGIEGGFDLPVLNYYPQIVSFTLERPRFQVAPE